MISEKARKLLNSDYNEDFKLGLIVMFQSKEIQDLFTKLYFGGQQVLDLHHILKHAGIFYFSYKNQRFGINSNSIFKSVYPISPYDFQIG